MINLLKIISLFIFFLFLIYILIIYFFLNNINEDEIIFNLQNNNNINLTKNKETHIAIFPKINISANYNFNNLKKNIVANNLNIKYTQSLFSTIGQLNLNINNFIISNLSFNEIILSGKINFLRNYFFNNYDLNYLFDGKYNIKGKFLLTTSNEEKFIISFLKLFFEKLENDRNDKFALSTLMEALNNNKSLLKGSITKENNIFSSNNLFIENESNKILLSGFYNFLNDEIKFDLDLEQNGEIFISAEIDGKINSPKIKIDKNSKFFENVNQKNNLIEESVMQFLNSFLGIND